LNKLFISKTFLKAAMFITAGFALTNASAYADAVYSFDLVWAGTSGADITGTGTVTFDNTIPLLDGFSAATTDTDGTYTTKVDGLSILMSNGASFNLATDPSYVGASFSVTAGALVLDSLSYAYYPSNNNLPRINLGGLTYNFQPTASSNTTVGSITDFTPYTAAPEPASILLALPALMLFAGWRLRKAPAKS
jgi:hypothetical protein